MSEQSLYIAFGSHQVAVKVDKLAIAADLERWFQAMLIPEPTRIVRQLFITEANGRYTLQDGMRLNKTLTNVFWLLQAVKYEVVTSLIEARPDLLWFHAGAVADEKGAIIVAAPGGGGKSTLITKLCQYGWRYLSDDAIPLDLQTGKVIPFLQTPRVRENTGGTLVPAKQLSAIPKFEVMLTSDRLCCSPMPLQGIVFPCYSPETTTQLTSCSPANAILELLRHCINFTEHKRTAIQQLFPLIQPLPAANLVFSNAEEAVTCLLDWKTTSVLPLLR